jgi:predicted RNA methylase
MNAHAKTQGTGTALVTKATVVEMVGYRDEAIVLYRAAFEQIAAADEAIKAAHAMVKNFRAENRLGYNEPCDDLKAFSNAVNLPDAALFMKVAERLTDIAFWTWLIERADLARLMDKEAKEELRAQLRYEPERPKRRYEVIDKAEAAKSFPPVTVENVLATIEGFTGQADLIFQRGIANAFSKLDRRFRSHDGFKIGGRVILSRLMSDGWWNHHSNHRDTLTDIERAFAVLDGKPDQSFKGAELAMSEARGGVGRRDAFKCETEYFRINCFQNGNAHLWMKRADLVGKVNRLLGEYYGEVIPDGAQTEDDPLANKKTTLAKNYGFFPTPDAAAEMLIKAAYLGCLPASARILEPSAGFGALSSRCAKFGRVDCVEIHPDRAAALRQSRNVVRLYQCDFLTLTPATTGLYERIVMNPPFDRERDIDHVIHAWDFLAPGGRLVSIMSAGTEFRETKKAISFRAMVEKYGEFRDLPDGSFASVGTNVNTLILTLKKRAV